MRKRTLDRLEREVGELIARHEGEMDYSQFAPYRDDPVGFAREVLGVDLWEHQERALELVCAHPAVAWMAGHAVGKTVVVSIALLWQAYCRRGLGLLGGPTARTGRETVMRKELARLFHRTPELKGDLYADSLRIEGDVPAILAYTASSAGAATGQHDARGGVLAVLDEANRVEEHMWTAWEVNATGADDKLFVCGNPTRLTGSFFRACQPSSSWEVLQTSVFDHPNLNEGGRYIAGGPSEGWLDRQRDKWGEGSGRWLSRVEGRFPLEGNEGLYPHEDIVAAIERGKDSGWVNQFEDAEPVLGVDVARHGMDSTVVCIRRGRHVERFVSWSGASTTETTRAVQELASEVGVRPNPPAGFRVEGWPWGEIVVDANGIGAGVVDNLQDKDLPAYEFKAGKRAKDRRRFRDAKASSYWRVRDLLEDGEISLPDDDLLREEMLEVEWSPDAKDRVAVEGKDELRRRIGRSSDRLDALTMAFAESGRRRPRVTRSVTW